MSLASSLQQHLILPISGSCHRVEGGSLGASLQLPAPAQAQPCLWLGLLSNEASRRGNACGMSTGGWKEQ